MRPQSLSEYPPGTTVFAKLKGYPWWPARIEDDQTVPSKVLKQKAKTKGPLWTVFFYGSKDYGFFGPDAIRPFDRPSVERDLKGKKFKNKDLEKAVRQALDPALLEEAMEADEEEEESDVEEEKKKPAPSRGKKRQAPTRKKAATNGRKRAAAREEVEEEEKSSQRTTKARTPKGDDEDMSSGEGVGSRTSKRRKASLSETSQSNAHQETPELEQTPQFLKIRYLRHKLQKLVYDKRPGEIPSEDYPKIVEALADIEEQHSIMTYDLLRSTKIARVVKSAFKYKGEPDYKAIQDRSRNILEDWRARFEQKSQPTANIPSSAEESKKSEEVPKDKGSMDTHQETLSTFPPLIDHVNPEDKR